MSSRHAFLYQGQNLVFFTSFALLGVGLAHADYFEIRRLAIVRMTPVINGKRLTSLEPGLRLEIVSEDPKSRYVHIRLPDSDQDGYISRAMGRPFPGDPPLQDPESLAAIRVRHLGLGKPVAYLERIREGYAVGYDARLKIPIWVQYELGPEDLKPEHGRRKIARTDDFRADPTLPLNLGAIPLDFAEDGNDKDQRADYAKGHLVPAADRRSLERLMSETFLLTNMVPQIGAGFNGSVWRVLEEDIRKWVEQFGQVTIIAGPAFVAQEDGREQYISYRVIGSNQIAVPTHLFKIIVDHPDGKDPRVLAFLLDNRDYKKGEKYSDFMVTVDHLENITGLDFLSALDDGIESKIESSTVSENWLDEAKARRKASKGRKKSGKKWPSRARQGRSERRGR